MQHRELQIHLWNLSMSAVASTVLAACSPLIVPVAETDTGSSTDPGSSTSPDPATTSPDADTTPAPQCQTSSDCPFGYDCLDGVCVFDDYGDTCADDPCCSYYCDTDTDSDTDGGSCRSHVDCDPWYACSPDSYCVYALVLPLCDDEPEIVPLALPTMSDDVFFSLAFVDANGDPSQDLVVGRSDGTELLLGPGDGPPIPLPVPLGSLVLDATAGDLDDDGQAELILSTAVGSLHVLASDGVGGYVELLAVQDVGPMRDLATLQWNGDGLLDLVGRIEGDEARVYWGDGAGGFAEVYTLEVESPVVSLALADLEGDPDGDVILQDQGGVKRFEGNDAGDLSPDGLLPSAVSPTRGVLAGGIGSGAVDDVVGHTWLRFGTLLELWPDALEPPRYYRVLTGLQLAAGMGDVNADGVADVVLGGEDTIDYARGSFETGTAELSCVGRYNHEIAFEGMAVGDFDGNLRADVAIGNDGGVVVLLSQ